MKTIYSGVADLGPVRVAVQSEHRSLLDYLREFYPVQDIDQAGDVDWTIEARLREPDPSMATTPWQVGYQSDHHAGRTLLCSPDWQNLAITARKAIREVLLDYCETRRYTMLHASALADDDQVVIVVGDKGSGKTTLAVNGAMIEGLRYLSNDHLILYRDEAGLVLTSLPTPIPVKIGTYLDYAAQLGEPWQNEGVDIDAHRQMAAADRYALDRRLLYTYRGLGQRHPSHTQLNDRQVVVVLAKYGSANTGPGLPVAVGDPMTALWPHVRFDWMFDPTLNTHYLPRTERDRAAYSLDARARLTELIAGSQVVSWEHQGKVRLLLDSLTSSASEPR